MDLMTVVEWAVIVLPIWLVVKALMAFGKEG